jgi:periplasmic divalent cation tolerance protein
VPEFVIMKDPSMTESSYIIVLTTLPADGDVAEFARLLVEERLAACVSAYPEMQSFYRWQDTLESDSERQIVIKTTSDRLQALWERVRSVHPYEVPEFLVLPVIEGSDAYLNWMREATKTSAPDGSP